MLDVMDIPTPLVEEHERVKVEISTAIGPRIPTLNLILLFARFLLTNLWRRLCNRYDPDETAIRLRAVFEELGGLWIKIGQLLSLRTDVFSEAICRELGRLQYRALGFPFNEARATVEASLGAPLSTVFASFDEMPLAAASVCQFHCAVLRDCGTHVGVKVLRPDAERVFKRDLRNISRFIWLLELFNVTPHVHWRKALWELEQMVAEELDFRYEAANMRRMRKTLRKHGVYVAKVFLEHSSAQVLVIEFLAGVLMSDFIRIGQSDPERLAAWCAKNRIEPKKLGKRLFESALRQLLEDNLFHADLHPGNIMVLRDSKMALIDFGTIGSCDQSFLLTYKASLAALAKKDYLCASDMTLRLAITPPDADSLESLRKEMVRSYRYWEGRTHLHGLNYHERSLAAAGADSGRVMFKYKVQLTWEFMRISRTWGTLDASLSFLLPEANYMRMFSSYFRKSQARRMTPRNILSEISTGIGRTVSAVTTYQDMLAPTVRKHIILSPSLIDASTRMMRFMRALLRAGTTVMACGAALGAMLFVHRFHPDLLWFHSDMLTALADDELTTYEIWWLALTGLVLTVWAFRRSLSQMKADS